jgi:hypothetical protein
VSWTGALSESFRALGALFGSPLVTWLVLAMALAGLLLLRRSGPIVPLLLVLGAANLAVLAPLREIHHQVSPRYATALEVPVWIGLGAWVAQSRRAAVRRVAWAALAALALWLASTSLRLYVLRSPGWYAPGEEARRAREHVGSEDGFVFFPAWLAKLGWYYGLEARPPCRTSTTWVLFGYVRGRDAVSEGADLLAELAARCGARFDRAHWLERLATEDAVLARIERGGEIQPAANP